MQGEGLRVLSFRHEQSAGYAAAIAGFLTQKPGVCLPVSAPGFLNGLTALAHATTTCYPMILISGSSERSEEHTSELQSLMRISYAVFCLKNTQPSHHKYNTGGTPC